MNAVSISNGTLVELVAVAAQHRTSVEAVVQEAIRTYLEDLECGLLCAPPPEPAHITRLRLKEMGRA